MQKVLSNLLWRKIKAEEAKAKVRQAAIAYVTRDLVGFEKGDGLVTDASKRAVRMGETSAKLLSTLFRKGVELYSCAGLHAKVLLLDGTAVIGARHAAQIALLLQAVEHPRQRAGIVATRWSSATRRRSPVTFQNEVMKLVSPA